MDFNFNIWYETYDPDFIDINLKSRVPEKWMNFNNISDKYKDSIIKPINPYLEYMCPPPRLISINDNKVVLEQDTYAEIMLNNTKNKFKNIEKVWLRQYYQTLKNFDKQDCFDPCYVTFMPWIIDENVMASISSIENSAFQVKEDVIYLNKTNSDDYVSSPSILFAFKDSGIHMKVDKEWGIIRKHSPLFCITIEANDIIIEKIKEFYEKE